ncbi:MAG: BLUF domain-containing protein [bacterium]
MRLCKLIYKSEATSEVVSNETISSLLEFAKSANAENDITGALVLSGRDFLQYLEGPPAQVNQLYARILKDPRHQNVQLVSYDLTCGRRFQDWDMRLIDLFDLPLQARQFMALKYPHNDGAIEIPVDAVQAVGLLTDAIALCDNKPWERDDASSGSKVESQSGVV